MGQLVNLRIARKQAKRAKQSRVAHGRPKAERRLGEARNDKA